MQIRRCFGEYWCLSEPEPQASRSHRVSKRWGGELEPGSLESIAVQPGASFVCCLEPYAAEHGAPSMFASESGARPIFGAQSPDVLNAFGP